MYCVHIYGLTCVACATGTASAHSGAIHPSVCVPCEAGQYANSDTAASACLSCAAGTYSASTVIECTYCAPGFVAVGLGVYCALVDLNSSGSPGVRPTPGLTSSTKYPISLCVCKHVCRHPPTHHPNTRQNTEIYKTNPLSLPLPKHGLRCQQQALSMA